MNNERVDECIHSALKSEAPYTLKQSLAAKMRLAESRSKQRHMFPLKRASAAAVVLICAMGVMQLDKTTAPDRSTSVKKEAVTGRSASDENVQIRAAVTDEASQTENESESKATQSPAAKVEKEATAVYDGNEKAAPAEEADEACATVAAEPATTEAENATAAEYAAVLSLQDTEEKAFSRGGSSASSARGRIRQRLEDLFAEGYDYRTAIYEAILSSSDDVQIYNLTEIVGDEAFECTPGGELTLIFPEGSIAPSEYGQIRLYAGKIENGILIK